MAKIIRDFGAFKLALDDHGSGNERMLLQMANPVSDYAAGNFDVKAGDTVIDIGAHIGRFSIYAATRAARVLAYEPDLRNMAKLKENVVLNNLHNIFCLNKAVNATGGVVDFHWSENPSENSMFERNQSLPSSKVAGTTLQDIFLTNNLDRCDFLKMDCEGAEYEILFSLPGDYFKKIQKIVLEYHDNLYHKKSLKDLIWLLSKNGFQVRRVNRGAWYTGILQASRAAGRPYLHNYLRTYLIDLVPFCWGLAKKKIFGENKK